MREFKVYVRDENESKPSTKSICLIWDIDGYTTQKTGNTS